MTKYFLLTFDFEAFDMISDTEESYRVSRKGAFNVEKLLYNVGVHATIFTTVDFALRNKGLTKSMSRAGHEIALHGYMEPDKCGSLKTLISAVDTLEELINKPVTGFRSHLMKHPNYEMLKSAGLRYDSSIHPTYIPGRYNYFLAPRRIQMKEGIVTIPVSVVPLVRLPFAWFWFRNFGLRYAKICTMLSIKHNHICTYFHPWEFTSIETKLPMGFKRNTGKKMMKMITEYIRWCKRRGFEFVTIEEYLKDGIEWKNVHV